MKLGYAIAIGAVLLSASPALAATYSLEIRMGGGMPKDPVRAIKVKGGTVGELVVDQTNGTATVQVTMPDGVCVARTSVIFRSGKRADTMTYNVCSEQGLTVSRY